MAKLRYGQIGSPSGEPVEMPDGVAATALLRWGGGVFDARHPNAAGGIHPSRSPAENRAAIQAALAAGRGARVHIGGSGEYRIDQGFMIGAEYSYTTVTGDVGTTLRYADTLAEGTASGTMWRLGDELNPSAVLRGFRLTGLRCHGNRDSLTWHTTSHGIGVVANRALKDCQVDNVMCEGFLTNGIQISASGLRVVNVYCHRNVFHGLAVSTGDEFGDPVEVYNATCEDNGGYGIDVSKGRVVGDNWIVRRNGTRVVAGGVKYSEGCEYLQVGQILSEDNNGAGFRSTGESPNMEVEIGTLVCRRNSGYGIRIASARRLHIGRIVSYANNPVSEGGPTAGDVYFTLGVRPRIDSIYVADSPAHGLVIDAATVPECRIGHIEAERCQLSGLRVSGVSADACTLVVDGGVMRECNQARVAGNEGAAIQVRAGGSTKLRGIVWEDRQGVPSQTAGIYVTSTNDTYLDGCHFGAGIVTGQQVYSSTAGTRVRFGRGNTGITTHQQGTMVGDGRRSSYTQSLGLTAGLGGAVLHVQVTPASVDAAAPHYISAVSSSSLTVAYLTPPPEGTGTVSLRWDVAMEIRR